MKVGDKVTWHHVPRGGYCYHYPVDATVTKINPRTIEIEAPLKNGKTKRVRVRPESLRAHQREEER